ncbi:MAG: acyl-CoA dehydratase activase [Planctomycetota bacterium]|jgi:predicted CoA-substrate-specific enzyme activase
MAKSTGSPAPHTVGIDVGARSTKAVALDDRGGLVGHALTATGWDPQGAVEKVFRQVRNGRRRLPVASTGFGRHLVEFADRKITEITCHAAGVHRLDPEVRTVVDIGGQDAKVIRVDRYGYVQDFVMNDRCAAGTGKFLEFLAATLKVGIEAFAGLAKGMRPAQISSMCTVFAETEVLDLVATGRPTGEIVAGIHRSVARRLAASMRRVGWEPPVAFSGGVALNEGVVDSLSSLLDTEVRIIPKPQFAGAFGAALLARE